MSETESVIDSDEEMLTGWRNEQPEHQVDKNTNSTLSLSNLTEDEGKPFYFKKLAARPTAWDTAYGIGWFEK